MEQNQQTPTLGTVAPSRKVQRESAALFLARNFKNDIKDRYQRTKSGFMWRFEIPKQRLTESFLLKSFKKVHEKVLRNRKLFYKVIPMLSGTLYDPNSNTVSLFYPSWNSALGGSAFTVTDRNQLEYLAAYGYKHKRQSDFLNKGLSSNVLPFSDLSVTMSVFYLNAHEKGVK